MQDQPIIGTEEDSDAASKWFSKARFGLFVHFGLYSGAARHDWVQNFETLTDDEYRPYFEHFDPDRFDGTALARRAKDSGMGYVVLTTKHHEGFSLWDTAHSDFSAPNACGRDLLADFVEGVRAEGLGVGLYYSLVDWHHPDFTVDYLHPRRLEKNPDVLNEGRDMDRYREFLHSQVRELLTNYGKIDYIFFDYSYSEDPDGRPGKGAKEWNSEALLKMCRELQPDMLVNDRLGIPGDFVTPEQYQPTAPLVVDGVPQLWEACQTLDGSWGYHRDNKDRKSPKMLLQMLVDSVSMNGNMLLNTGPNGRGAIAPRDKETLDIIGEWMDLHRDAVVGAGHAPFPPPREGVYTLNGNRLFLHLFNYPLKFVHLRELAGKVSYARFVHDASWLKMSVTDPSQKASQMTPAGEAPDTLTIHLPVTQPDVLVPVIELTLN